MDPTRSQRLEQLAALLQDVKGDIFPSFLPEQYFLADRLTGWHNIEQHWNWEVFFQWDVPRDLHPAGEAWASSWHQGWSSYYNPGPYPSAEAVLEQVRIWHFSGVHDTQPWLFADLPNAEAVRRFAADRWYAVRDPGGIVAAAVAEWREALDEALDKADAGLAALRAAFGELARRAKNQREGKGWWCDACGWRRSPLRAMDLRCGRLTTVGTVRFGLDGCRFRSHCLQGCNGSGRVR